MGNFKARRMKHVNGSYTHLYISSQSVKDHNTIVNYYNSLLKNTEEGKDPIVKIVIDHERYGNIIMN